jgi:hypothetical protein
MLRCLLTADYDEFLLKQEEPILRLLEILSQEGVSFSVPAQLNILTRDAKPNNQPISGRPQTGGV